MPLLNGLTPEIIRDRILSRMNTALQTREGSFAFDMVAPTAFEIWRAMMTLDELLYAFFVDEDSGPYLDANATLLGLERRQGAKATVTMHFTGRDGVEIPSGTSFYTADGLEFLMTETVIIADESGTGTAEAIEEGDAYNVAAGSITLTVRNISGLTAYINDEAVGGADAESDAALFARLSARRKSPSTSGNPAHYIEWATTCEGVGAAKVTRCWNGPGTVRVLVAGYDHEPIDDVIVQACSSYINEQQHVCVDCTVVSVSATEISVSATLVLDEYVTLAQVQADFEAALKTHLAEVSAEYFAEKTIYDYPVYYNRIAALLMSINGVMDYSNLLLNGATDNVVIPGTGVPVPGEVSLQ